MKYQTKRGAGIIFVKSVWLGVYFIAVSFPQKSSHPYERVFAPFKGMTFYDLASAEKALQDYAEEHGLQEVF